MARKCPFCHKSVGVAASKCWKCGGDLDASDPTIGSPAYSSGAGKNYGGTFAILNTVSGLQKIKNGIILYFITSFLFFGLFPIAG